MKKAIFFDIDGTLIDCVNGLTDITPKVKKAIKKLQSDGNYVFIATGRPYAFLSESLLNFGFDGFVLTNGAQVIINNKMIYKEPLDKDFVKELAENFDELHIQYILQGETYSYIKNEFKEFYSLYTSIDIPEKYLTRNYDINDIDVYKIEMLCPDDRAMDYCLSIVNTNKDYTNTYDINLKTFELYSKHNTKATGILKALEYLDIPLKNSYAFGDGMNDIEMLSTVGCGIAMGNANDDVKIYAKEITDTVHNDGIAVGIDKFIL
ncbi:HAD family hydrolase [Clostridium sardiniense]|uniref:HAD family hydrolase n=1 Tax=Clostridium sardiniense TaxID=29369 RepID=UPI00195E3731|nr:HAD family hydrolase [Clostridium sardiniense]MBM7834912.1 Cof subfamily protein (haloacid dehalogenase superfamily) [Clostridium sardiniense]